VRRLLFFLAILIAACGKQDDSEKLQKSVVSWSATLQLVADARLRNEVSAGYARATIEEAIDDLSGETAKPSIPRSLTIRAERVIALGADLQEAIDNDNQAAIARAKHQLESLR
jgi:hypothetical protein